VAKQMKVTRACDDECMCDAELWQPTPPSCACVCVLPPECHRTVYRSVHAAIFEF